MALDMWRHPLLLKIARSRRQNIRSLLVHLEGNATFDKAQGPRPFTPRAGIATPKNSVLQIFIWGFVLFFTNSPNYPLPRCVSF